MGDAVEGSNPSPDGVVALSNYIHVSLLKGVWSRLANDDGFRRFEGRDITSYDGRVVKAGA